MERTLGVLKNSPADDAKAVTIPTTAILSLANPMEGPVRDVKDLLVSALGTSNAIRPAMLYQILLAGFFGREEFKVFFQRHALQHSAFRLWCQLGENSLSLSQSSMGSDRRLRATMMTDLVDALGFLPAAVSTRISAQTQRPLAVVVIGGALAIALLTRLLASASAHLSVSPALASCGQAIGKRLEYLSGPEQSADGSLLPSGQV
jgi:hypothetical protein